MCEVVSLHNSFFSRTPTVVSRVSSAPIYTVAGGSKRGKSREQKARAPKAKPEGAEQRILSGTHRAVDRPHTLYILDNVLVLLLLPVIHQFLI